MIIGGASAADQSKIPMPTTRNSLDQDTIEVEYVAPDIDRQGHAVFIALDYEMVGGSAQVPYGQRAEGSTVTLPFRADRIYATHVDGDGLRVSWRKWRQSQWSTSLDATMEFTANVSPGRIRVGLRIGALGTPRPKSINFCIWAKNLNENDGWGRLLPYKELKIRGGINDQSIDEYYVLDLEAGRIRQQSRRGANTERGRIYQLMPRLFSNTNARRKPNGTLAENGVGKFNDLNATALGAIKEMNFTHVWLTGVLSQATSTNYSEIGLPADEPDLLKGLAGSPYAVRDYFDVCPDYAVNPADRLTEFESLIGRAHAAGLRVIIDFIPNHVARCYRSIIRPGLNFGRDDDPAKFFDPQNNFYWLQRDSPGGGPPLRLPSVAENGELVSPTCRVLGHGDGVFSGERERGRVTGNNVVSWRPSLNDWYETVKLNYGYDFTTGQRAYPCAENPDALLPDTWLKMDAVLAYWQSFGIDGFRCDMSHMVPPEFWSWALDRARQRDPSIFFAAEAYDNDPMKVGRGNVMIDLLNAGFDAVYDDPSYKSLKYMYDGGNWANDLDRALASAEREYIFQNSLRYAENHDEVRLAGRDQWGNLGAKVGRSASAILYGVARGPVLLYSGQEVGEPADDAEGFGGDDARTTIFDYWSMPELSRWVNGHRFDGGQLRPEQQDLRKFYARLLGLVGEPAFHDGEFFALNYANIGEPGFGRLDGETASGHWLYAFLRSDRTTAQRFLVIANLHPNTTFTDVRVRLPSEALDFIGMPRGSQIRLEEQLSTSGSLILEANPFEGPVQIGAMPPLTPYYFAFQNV
jgi:glycosidase